MIKLIYISLIKLALFSTGLALTPDYKSQDDKQELKTVQSVDLKRYAGVWYEIARYPNKFQKQCVGNTTAEYILEDENELKVINRCLKKNGKTDSATGEARVKDKTTNAKLEVRFAPKFLSFLPFVWGDYWIIDLGKDYRYSVVGSPDRKYLWILSRTPELDETIYQNILQTVKEKGFDPNRLVKTPQK